MVDNTFLTFVYIYITRGCRTYK